MGKKDILEEIVEAPSVALENVVKLEEKLEHSTVVKDGKKYLKSLGPGVVTGASDDDPSGIATYSQAGAQFGTGLLWTSLWLFPMMAIVQEMCARIALATGRGLTANIKKFYSKKVLYGVTLALFLANTFNIGANLGAMAKAVQLVVPGLNFYLIIIVMGFVGLYMQVVIPYKKYVRYLKYFSITLLAYIATGLIIHMDWAHLAYSTILPQITFSKSQILMITALIGTTISPYLFFWQASQEIEEEISAGKSISTIHKGTNKSEVKKMRFDVWSGMFFSNLVMFFIIAVCATVLFQNGITNINTATEAAEALRPFAGNMAYILFALGIIGTGMLSIPILAGSASYAISESFGWKEGLYRKLHDAHAFYSIIIISVILGMLMNFVGLDPIKSLIYSAILNGMIAPFILACVVDISSNSGVMGKFKNKKFYKILGWIITILVKISAVAAFLVMI